MYVKRIIKNILPYFIYKYVHNRNNMNYFKLEYDEFINSCSDNSDKKKEEEKYKTILSVQGLGFSGSGAVLDLLCEFSNIDVIGTNYDGKSLSDHNGMFECDFLRISGGIFEVEKYLDSNNIFHNDALLNRMLLYINSFKLFKNDPQLRKSFYSFFSNIVDYRIKNISGNPYNPHLYNDYQISDIFFLRNMSVDEYRTISQTFLRHLFNSLNINKKDILVFDQMFSDLEFDMEKYNCYIPNSKLILVYRDPRDIFAFAYDKKITWIPHDNVDSFIKWFFIITRKVDLGTKDFLVVQFEKLICDYENECRRITNYLGIPIIEHIRKKMFFKPEISAKNIGIWKRSCLPQTSFSKIKFELEPYCFEY